MLCSPSCEGLETGGAEAEHGCSFKPGCIAAAGEKSLVSPWIGEAVSSCGRMAAVLELGQNQESVHPLLYRALVPGCHLTVAGSS